MIKSNSETGFHIVELSKQFSRAGSQHPVLQSISYSFVPGVSYALCGISGSGKSTFMHILAGFQSPDSGDVVYNGRSLSTFSDADISNFHLHQIGFVFQKPYLVDELTVLENVMLKGVFSEKHSIEWAHEVLCMVGLEHYQDADPRTLSGGQQQRVALARALYGKPRFLLADEPTGSLDQKTAQEIVDVMVRCQKKWDMGLIISSHDPYVAKTMDRCIQLSQGVVKEV